MIAWIVASGVLDDAQERADRAGRETDPRQRNFARCLPLARYHDVTTKGCYATAMPSSKRLGLRCSPGRASASPGNRGPATARRFAHFDKIDPVVRRRIAQGAGGRLQGATGLLERFGVAAQLESQLQAPAGWCRAAR